MRERAAAFLAISPRSGGGARCKPGMPTSDSLPGALLAGLAPVIAPDTRILILGSFPGAASLAAGQYYAHPRNLFWPILSVLTGEPLAELPYADRLPRLLAHRIGLWDVLGACEREGSLDANIRKPAANDFARLRELCPELRTVGFNGQAAAKFAPQFEANGYRTVQLPSTSPAHAALSFDEKLAAWRTLVKPAR
jgi:hypoxanthine-DNA glycosylase